GASGSPFGRRPPVGGGSPSPLCAGQEAESTFQRLGAAATSMVLATAPASRSGCHAPRIAFELPVACTPSFGLTYSLSLGGACSSRTCFRSTSSSSAISIGIDV